MNLAEIFFKKSRRLVEHTDFQKLTFKNNEKNCFFDFPKMSKTKFWKLKIFDFFSSKFQKITKNTKQKWENLFFSISKNTFWSFFLGSKKNKNLEKKTCFIFYTTLTPIPYAGILPIQGFQPIRLQPNRVSASDSPWNGVCTHRLETCSVITECVPHELDPCDILLVKCLVARRLRNMALQVECEIKFQLWTQKISSGSTWTIGVTDGAHNFVKLRVSSGRWWSLNCTSGNTWSLNCTALVGFH